MIRVCIVGAAGRMGTEAVKTVLATEDMKLAFAVDTAQGESNGIPIVARLPHPLQDCDVMVELTHADSATEHAVKAAESGVSPVIGASGLDAVQQKRVADACAAAGIGGILVPNFAIGAVLMMRFADMAARWLPNAEVVEMHHNKKQDAPSGTGIRTAELIAGARNEPNPDPTKIVKHEGARGALVEGVRVHSVRLPGLVAHQTVMFGGEGEVLTIHHDSMHRGSFMEGMKLAVRGVRSLDGFVVGLDALMFDA